MTKFTKEEFISRARSIHGGKYDYSKVDYVNSRTKVCIICSDHGDFWQLPSSHLSGNGCPKCARVWTEAHRRNLQISSRCSRGMTTEEWISRAKRVHGNKYDYSSTVYVNQRTSVDIICPVHGLFSQKADSHLRGCGCRFCGYESENHYGVHEWSDEQREKIVKTCRERYGADRYLDSEEGRCKIHYIKSKPQFKNKMHDMISSDDVQNKIKTTCIARYGTASPMQTDIVFQKVIATKAKNGTWKTSLPEDTVHAILCDMYGFDDIIRQHRSNEYPFLCDFYIVSKDTYIEMNLNWTHGKHWYGDGIDDAFVLGEWQRRSCLSKYYANAVETWTKRDVSKRRTAQKNNLNYLVFWKTDLSDFREWISVGCPSGKDYTRMYSWKSVS